MSRLLNDVFASWKDAAPTSSNGSASMNVPTTLEEALAEMKTWLTEADVEQGEMCNGNKQRWKALVPRNKGIETGPTHFLRRSLSRHLSTETRRRLSASETHY